MIVALGLTLILTDFIVIIAYCWCEATNFFHTSRARETAADGDMILSDQLYVFV